MVEQASNVVPGSELLVELVVPACRLNVGKEGEKSRNEGGLPGIGSRMEGVSSEAVGWEEMRIEDDEEER